MSTRAVSKKHKVDEKNNDDKLTRIDPSHNRPPHRRRKHQQVRHPTITHSRRTPRNPQNIIPLILHHIMEKHLQNRTPETPDQTNHNSLPLLPLTQPQARLLSIHNPRQSAQNTRHAARDPDGSGDLQLDLDVAEAGAAEPLRQVVVGPEEGVEG
jgi:hypothetical protein